MNVVRLPFELPPFSRITWASAALRSKWGERLSRVRRALAACDRPARWSGILLSRVVKIYPYQEQDWIAEARALGLEAQRLEAPHEIGAWARDEDIHSGKSILLRLGRPGIGDRVEAAPPCCAAQAGRRTAFRSAELALLLSSVEDAEPGSCSVLPQSWETNLFWRGVGVSLLPHVPCSVGCAQSKAIACALVARMIEDGEFQVEAAWLREMLSWSLSWSALHGIAELKTPVFKACSSTDATAGRHELRLEGSSPEDAAAGVGFPYLPRSHPSRPVPADALVRRGAATGSGT